MIKKVNNIKREVKLGDSKLDFVINNNCYLEVKSPLHNLNIKIPKYIALRNCERKSYIIFYLNKQKKKKNKNQV